MIKKDKGYYFGEYEIEFEKYSGNDFSRRCFIFPGQGVASLGMLKEIYLQSEIIQAKFLEADREAEALGLSKISDYILAPDALVAETRHITANLALFTLECALFDVLISQKIIPKLITGHSFGEYAALVAAGTVSFLDMFSVIYHREILCPAPNVLGYMIAIKASAGEVREILGRNEYYISNLNSPDQTVISVPVGGLEKIKNILAERKMRHVVLVSVPQPYHSPYLVRIRNKIADYLKNAEFTIAKPLIPIYSSVLKKIIDQENFTSADIKNILENQITEPVDFIKQIKFARSFGCVNFLEMGPKKIFSGFVEEILGDEKIKTDYVANLSIFKKEKIEKYDSEQKGKLFLMVSRTIGKITGYEIEKISFEDRFQEDLGIDSIKKADILLTILDESGIAPGEEFNTSQFRSVKDTVRYIQTVESMDKSPQEKQKRRKADFRRWVFFWKEKGVDRKIIAKYHEGGYLPFALEEIFKDPDGLLKKIFAYLNNTPADELCLIMYSDFQEFNYENSIAFFKFFRTFFKETKITGFNLLLVSYGKQAACLDGYASFLKSVKKEFPKMFFKYIRIDTGIRKEETAKIILQEANESFGEDVLYRDEKRFVKEVILVGAEENKNWLNDKSVIIAIGGARGVTFSLIKNISEKYRPIIYFIGRSLEKNETVQNNLKELRMSNSNVSYTIVDARNKESLAIVFAKIKKKHKKINLVINGAGVVEVGFLTKKSDEKIDYEFGNKVLPALNVLELAAKYEVIKVINFSSIISNYGSAGQSIYTAANAMVEGFSCGKATTISWPAWNGVGMTADKVTLQKLKETGVSLLSPERANELFVKDMEAHISAAVYYLDKFDDHQLSFPLADVGRFQTLLGKMKGEFNLVNAKISFEKTFDLSRDIYLIDHKISENVYVPAATGVAMFFCLAKLYFKKNPVLKDIEIKNPIIVKGIPVRCDLVAENNSDNGLNLSLKSKMFHFSGTAQADNDTEVISKIKLPKAETNIAKEFLYADYFSERSMKYGKIFQCIEAVSTDVAGKQFFKINNLKLYPVLGLGFYDKLIQWVDTSFQALGACNLGKEDENKLMMIPVSIASLHFYSSVGVTDFLYIIPNNSEVGEDFIKGDVAVVNESGEIILALKGVLLRAIAN